ncbi:MAG: FtsQ-type POTRA domain-containing protein [Kiritimatiellae bacterium]|nr:FtsQ-type POTRA domain-containing protein [Kiritimatiellia bacterium]
MLFDDEDISGRRFRKGKRNRRTNSVLGVTAKPIGWVNADSQRIMISLLAVTAIAVVGAIFWMGLTLAKEALFSQNDRFLVKNVEIDVKAGCVVDANLVRDYTHIVNGTNMFAFDIKHARNEILNVPNVKSVEIIRQLPDTVKISIAERIAVARIGRTGAVGADVDGVVFVLRRSLGKLPVILGCRPADPVPGSRVNGIGLAALTVLDVCRELRSGLQVSSVDVSRPGHLLVRRSGSARTVKLPWPGGEEMPPGYRELIKSKLLKEILIRQSARGEQHLHLDATSLNPAYPDQIIGQ